MIKKSLFICLLFLYSQIFAQVEEKEIHKSYSLNRFVEILKPFQSGDYAVGIQAKGKLANVVTNFGELASFHIFAPSLEWPAFGEGQDDEQQYGWGVDLMMGYRGDVIESFQDPASDLISREWQPANENLFSGVVTVSETDLTPIMATSDNRNTWPMGNDGQPFWPGYFRQDTLGNIYNGEFTSERDLFCVYTDEGNDTPYGLRVEQTAYSFGRRYAEDFLVYRFNITNTSNVTLDSLYPGMMVQFLIDFDNHDLINFIDSNADGQKDFVYLWDEDQTPREPWSKVGYIGLLVVKTPFDNGITNFHYFHDDFMPSKDEDFWMILTSDTTGIPDTTRTRFFHGSNYRLDDVSFAPALDPDGNNRGAEISWGFSCGPVSLSAGESIPLEIAVICGDDEQDLLANVDWVWFLANNAWNGSNPPNPPIVNAYSGDGKNTIVWDAYSAENSKDNITGLKDFEGYKIYRSTDRGKSWGKEITNGDGDFIAYKPLAQFDLKNEISGYDPISHQFIGSNSGIVHTFIDSTVTNGLEYWYAVTSYDQGDNINQVESLESALGLDTSEVNIAWTMPSSNPQNFNPGELMQNNMLSPDSGVTDGEVSLNIIDPAKLKTRNYKLIFHEKTPVYEDTTIIDSITTFSLKDADTDEILISQHPLSDDSGDNIPVVDGFRLKIVDSPSGVKSEWTVVNGDTSTFIWTTVPWGANDFEVIYTDYSFKIVIDKSPAGGLQAPWFDLWHGEFADTSFLSGILADSLLEIVTTTNAHLPLRAYMISLENPVDVSDNVYLGEFLGSPFGLLSPLGWDLVPGGTAYSAFFPYPDRIIMEYITAQNDTHGVRLVTQNGPDTAIPPSDGDEFTIRIFRPFTEEIVYTFSTTSGSFVQTTKEDLEKVRVVPNPYFVTSAFGDRIMFTHLPNQCDIKIYNVAGDLIRSLSHSNNTSTEYWDLKNDEGLEIAYGLYVYVVRANNGEKHIGKFSVIR